MGVIDINTTLKGVIKDVLESLNKSGTYIQEFGFRTVPLSHFKGQKIAFDASVCLNAKLSTAHNELVDNLVDVLEMYDRKLLEEKFMKDILSFVGTFMVEGITPVFVFDGQTHQYKQDEVNKRTKEKREKTEYMERIIENYRNLHPLDRTQEMNAEVKKLIKNNFKIRREDKLLMKNVLTEIGICCIDAPYDAEKICASLSREGIVSAVFSTDTDCYPLGTSILISKISWNGSMNVCNIAVLPEILICLKCYFGYEVTLDIFIDLCIIHSCDFNNRMVIPKKKHDPQNPYKSCGPKPSLELIKQYGRFENFPPNLWPFLEPLKIGICRYMFSYEESGTDANRTNLNWTKFITNINIVLSRYKVENYVSRSFQTVDVNFLKIFHETIN